MEFKDLKDIMTTSSFLKTTFSPSTRTDELEQSDNEVHEPSLSECSKPIASTYRYPLRKQSLVSAYKHTDTTHWNSSIQGKALAEETKSNNNPSQDVNFEFFKYKYRRTSDSSLNLSPPSLSSSDGIASSRSSNSYYDHRRRNQSSFLSSSSVSSDCSYSEINSAPNCEPNQPIHYYSYGSIQSYTNLTATKNQAFIVEIKPPTPSRSFICETEEPPPARKKASATHRQNKTNTRSSTNTLSRATIEKMRHYEMQSLLDNSTLQHNNNNNNDSSNNSDGDQRRKNRNRISSLMQEEPPSSSSAERRSQSDNNLTWPKLKRSNTNPFDMNLSPLASLFPQSNFTTTRNHRSFSASDVDDHNPQQFQDVDANNQFDNFLSTLDRFEDDFDREAYEELIPLNIRMALENQIFGWDHLYSAALGHVMFPIIAYTLTAWTISLIGLRGVGCEKRFAWNCTMHKIYHLGEYESNYKPLFGMSIGSFIAFKTFLALWSALNTFRTIRRRRKVWLHHQVTEYFRRDTVAHSNMEQVDRETLLGRIRSKVNRKRTTYLHRRIMRKINKATGRFEKREKRRREFKDGFMEYEGDHHRRVQVLSQRGGTQRRNENEEEDYSIISTSSSYTHPEKESVSRNADLDLDADASPITVADEFFDTYQKYKRTAKEEYERDHADDNSTKHFYGHTMPAFAMQSILQDQIKFQNGPIQNVAYAHGGFFGAAPFMLANPHWIHILRQLMPDVYVEISRRVVHTPVPQLIHWAENNPIVAAYGTAHELEYFGKVPTLEWDVFLDPHLTQRVEVVLEARDSFLQGLAEKHKRIRTALSHKREERRYTSKMVNIAALLESEDDKKILHFYNTEIDKRVMLLVEHMLIAHGNLSQLALEQTGYLKHFNFSRVKHTRRTLGGGIYAKHWIMTYTEALKMSTELDEDLVPNDDCSMPNVGAVSTSSNTHHSSNMTPTNDARDDTFEFKSEEEPFSTLKLRRKPRNNDSPPPEQSGSSSCISSSLSTSSRQFPKGESSSLRTSTSFQDLAMAAVTNSSIEDSMKSLKKLMNCEAPLGLILDIKSRHVPKRVWALVLDCLRDMGARVEGIATFFPEDIRDITKYCAAPTKEIMFFHSAGDLQKACHDGLIRRGESVFFNAGSLFWNYPAAQHKTFALRMIRNVCTFKFDVKECKNQYRFQPYARVSHGKDSEYSTVTRSHFFETDSLVKHPQNACFKFYEGISSTIQQYKEHFNLSIGLYVQEFAIDEKSMELLVQYANKYSDVYDLGFSWGGVNGVTVRGIQPGRFTNTDGFWNQRYAGERWDTSLYPGRLA